MGKLGVIEPGFHTTLQDCRPSRGQPTTAIPSAGWLDDGSCNAWQINSYRIQFGCNTAGMHLEASCSWPFATDRPNRRHGCRHAMASEWPNTCAPCSHSRCSGQRCYRSEHSDPGQSMVIWQLPGTIQTESHFGSTSCYPPAQLGGNSGGYPLAAGRHD